MFSLWRNAVFNKNLIYGFILEYLKENNVDNLSFSLISKNTKISRTTLYSYYSGIWEIIEEINEYYINELGNVIKNMEPTNSVIPSKQNTIELLKNIYKNKRYYYVADKIQIKNGYKYLKEILLEKKEEFKIKSSSDIKQSNYIQEYFGLHVQFMIYKWIKEDFKMSINDQADLIDEYCRLVLK